MKLNFAFSVGISDFLTLRKINNYYVDKTQFIEELLNHEPNVVSMITRPRRFGKTLMQSMLDNFFNINLDSKAIFEGLSIAKNKDLCAQWMNQYPVISISLKEINSESYEPSLYKLLYELKSYLYKNYYIFDSTKVIPPIKAELNSLISTKSIGNDDFEHLLANSLFLISTALYQHWNKQIVILIDEYDTPINYAKIYDYFPKMVSFMRNFLGQALKDNPYLKFSVVTGCLRIAKESIFTGVNNFICHSINHNIYADKFGFLEQEVDQLLADTRLINKKSIIKEWYDGYVFGDNTEIYCPWDVLNYVRTLLTIKDAQPESYWINSSSNDIIINSFKSDDKTIIEALQNLTAGQSVASKIEQNITYDMLKNADLNQLLSILYFTGYLTKVPNTLSNNDVCRDVNDVLLKIPNKEIQFIFKKSLLDTFILLAKNNLENSNKLIDAFINGKPQFVTEYLTDLLIKCISCFDYHENFYHALVSGILISKFNNAVKTNDEKGLGRPDIFVQVSQNHFMFIEIKHAQSEAELSTLAKKALRQIHDCQYDAAFRFSKCTIQHWGLAFYKKMCIALVNQSNT
ncbi:MAG: AAA family ATPase [Desulfovibrionaceae bacterium]|nr:AAA family ATPase [Desulfovibrionaceae bacterium]